MKHQSALFAFVLAGAFASVAGAQVISYSPRTGDVWIDTQLGQVNDYGRRDRNYFVDDMVNNFGAPRYLVNNLLDTRRWAPGDVYYACALAYQAHRPCGDAVRAYDENKGKGWGVVAMRMGIKPGSAEFHALKGQVGKSNGRYQTHGQGHGPGNSEHGDQGKAHGSSQGRGDDERDDGRSENSDGKGKGKDKGGDNGHGSTGKGKDKGHGH